MLHPLVAVVTAVLIAANQPPPPTDAPAADAPMAPAPKSAIVGGRHIQPRANASQRAPDAAGISKSDADDVDRLYEELMGPTTPGAPKGSRSTMPQ